MVSCVYTSAYTWFLFEDCALEPGNGLNNDDNNNDNDNNNNKNANEN